MSHPAIDARGPRFTAGCTALILAAVLATAHWGWGVWLLGVQALFFAVGAGLGIQHTPTAVLFRRVVRPRLGPPTRWEDPRPPRFAQAIGLLFAVAGLIGFAGGVPALGYGATALAFVAALLNATIQFCLGCRIYGVCGLPGSQADHSTTDHTTTNATKKEVTT